jgi:4-amino-4-deoxy-L-arabinose transferase-like glycosyltransferase
MGLSARVFGFSSFSMLLPEAACTIAAVGLLYATVRRSLGASAGIIAGLVLALTPVTVAIGRVNNPDALLVLLLVGSAYLMTRALESGRTKHLVWCGALIGLAFMTKMLEGWMVAPALFGTYLLAAAPPHGSPSATGHRRRGRVGRERRMAGRRVAVALRLTPVHRWQHE